MFYVMVMQHLVFTLNHHCITIFGEILGFPRPLVPGLAVDLEQFSRTSSPRSAVWKPLKGLENVTWRKASDLGRKGWFDPWKMVDFANSSGDFLPKKWGFFTHKNCDSATTNGDFMDQKGWFNQWKIVDLTIKHGDSSRGFGKDGGDSGNLSILKWWYHWDIIYIPSGKLT